MDEPGLLLTLGVALSVFIGAISQRATGMGFALLSAPFLVLVLGPLQGILAVNAASVLANSLILVQVW
ncbi:MAG: sulfite exporter TauE/SafE family protein, partial [Brachybacterium tyrofermentans]